MDGKRPVATSHKRRRQFKDRRNTPRWPEGDTNMEANSDAGGHVRAADVEISDANDVETTSMDEKNFENSSDNSTNPHDSTIYKAQSNFDDDQSNNIESSGETNDGETKSVTKTKALRTRVSVLCNNPRANACARLIGRRRRLNYQRRCNKSNFDTDHDGDIDNDTDNEEEESDSIDDNNNGNSKISCPETYDDDDELDGAPISKSSGSKFALGSPSKVSFLRARMVQHHCKQSIGLNGERNFTSLKDVSKTRNHDNQACERQEQESSSQNQTGLSQRYGSIFERFSGFLRGSLTGSRSNTFHLADQDREKFDKTRSIELNDRQSSNQPSQHQASNNMRIGSNDNRYQPIHGYNGYNPNSRRKSSLKQRFAETQYSKPKGYSKLGNYTYRLSDKNESIFQELKRLLLLVVILCVSCFLFWKLYETLTEEHNYLGVVVSPSIQPEYSQYAVSTDAKPCAKVGAALLAKGGSAVDAVIGTLLCMGVAIPNSMGLGGGCFMTIYDAKKKESIAIDGREIAPDYATEDMYLNNSLAASRGPLSVGVPGELAAYWKAHQMYGKLPWSDLFNLSIDMAENGSPMVLHLAQALRNPAHEIHITPTMKKFFRNTTTGEYLNHGDLHVQKEYAETLRRIRDNGAKEFYGGRTGQLFIEDLKKQGGSMTLDNLVKYEAIVKKSLTYRFSDNLTLHTQPLPASGNVLSIILRIMKEKGYYGARPQASLADASLYYHRLVEAFKFAYSQRAALEDKPDDPERLSKLLVWLDSESFIKDAANKIDNRTHEIDYYGAKEYFQQDHGTAHASVIDGEGNAAAVTTSVNLYFGSGLISPSTGIVYNDVMDDFVSSNKANKFGLAPSKYNRIRPGKRPLSSMAPSVFTNSNGNVRLVIGASGGSMITSSIASVSLRNCFLGEDIKTAIDSPRIHHQVLPNQIFDEHNFPKDILHSLEEIYGHYVEAIKGRSSVVMALAASYQSNGTTTNKIITANSDYRKGGSVDGA